MAHSGAESTQAEVGHDGGAHPNFPPFDASTFPSQLVWFAITFGVLYYYMSKRALPQLGAVIQGRKARIAKDLDEATAMQQQADAAAAAHEKTLAEARAKAQSLAQAARDAAAADARPSARRSRMSLQAKLADAERRSPRRAPTRWRNVADDRARRRRRDRRASRRPAGRPTAIAAAVKSVKPLSGAA